MLGAISPAVRLEADLYCEPRLSSTAPPEATFWTEVELTDAPSEDGLWLESIMRTVELALNDHSLNFGAPRRRSRPRLVAIG